MIILALALTAAPPAPAPPAPAPSPPAESWKAFGVAYTKCDAWTSDRRDPKGYPAMAKLAWLGGFLSGLNLDSWAEGDGSLTMGSTLEEMTAWIDNYCASHPEEFLGIAASNLGVALLDRKPPRH